MSRRASLLAKQEKSKPRVRFPDELIFLDNIKGNDIQACHSMLRRASVQLDINGLDSNGLTPIHNAVLEGNLAAVKLLVQHGADVNRKDSDTWTPLHAACANGEADIARYLLSKGANKDIKTNDGERPLDLCDARDFAIISVMLESDKARKARLLSAPEEELEFDVDDKKLNDNSDDDHGDKLSVKLNSMSDSADSSPETPHRNRLKNDIKNANAYTKSSTAGLVKAMSHLQTVTEDSSPSTLSPNTVRQRNTASSLSPKSAHSPSDTAVPRPPKPPGQSILKKSPQQFRAATD
ncbi:unnamed protein product [Candidula unifasciata]|uniref:Protein phosphatase 1 regulatory subunit 12A n=1 Tax=Candidula unifasciata TaxID=100452 RepID=A0A8S4AEE8_9EUPU|nr:unnamed protein product [Candidula unifasciata]